MPAKVDERLDALLAWLLPPQCTLCGAAGSDRLPLCDGCRSELPYLGRACERCAEPLPVTGVCGRCLRRPPSQDRAHAAFVYAAPLDRLVRGRTTFIIAHRLSTVAAADRTVVLDNGRIVETGNHAGLLQKKGVYWTMWTQQTNQAEEVLPECA